MNDTAVTIILSITTTLTVALCGFVAGFYQRYKWDIANIEERLKWINDDIRHTYDMLYEHIKREGQKRVDKELDSWTYKGEDEAVKAMNKYLRKEKNNDKR